MESLSVLQSPYIVIEEEYVGPSEVTEADWVFASTHQITNQSFLTGHFFIVTGLPMISVVVKSPQTEQTIGNHMITVGQTIADQPEIVKDAIDSIRFSRRHLKPQV